MTQPPGYPNQPGDPYGSPGQPPQGPPPGQGWTSYPQPQDPYAPQPQDPYAPPPQDPYGPPTSGQSYAPPPTSAPPTSGQPYAPPGAPGYPPPGYPPPGQPTSGQPFMQPGQPFSPGPGQTGAFPTDPFGTSGFQPAPPKKKRGLMITLIAVAALLVLCGGGAAAYVIRNSNGTGHGSAVEATNGFLKAVYKDKNVEEATKYVCASARNKESLTKRIEDIRAYDTKLKEPAYTWPEPTVEKQTKESATLIVPVKVQTNDDKVAEQRLKILATNDNGWWVCEITTV